MLGRFIYFFIWISCIKIWHASKGFAPLFPRDGPFSWGWMSLSLLTCLTPPAQNKGKVPDSRVPRISQKALSTWYWRSQEKECSKTLGRETGKICSFSSDCGTGLAMEHLSKESLSLSAGSWWTQKIKKQKDECKWALRTLFDEDLPSFEFY